MSRPKSEIEVIARAVIAKGGRVLLARKKGADNAFLPGGHIEWNEPARLALRRELREEMGLKIRIGAFLGVVEHAFGGEKRRTHELNLLFLVPGSALPGKVSSREPKLEFFWHPIRDLGSVNLQPHPLQRLIPEMVRQKRPVWAGTME